MKAVWSSPLMGLRFFPAEVPFRPLAEALIPASIIACAGVLGCACTDTVEIQSPGSPEWTGEIHREKEPTQSQT